MTTKELVDKYYFHDSEFVAIREYPEENRIELDICVCLFMQDNYKKGQPKNGVIRFRIKTNDYINPFKDVEDIGDYEILDGEMKDGYLYFFCSHYADDGDIREMYIKAEDIEEELLYYGFPHEQNQ